MHILFVDESGTPPKPSAGGKYFVVAGIIVPELAWFDMKDALMGLKIRHKLRGEIKWRYFFASPSDDQKNPMRGRSQTERDQIRRDIYKIIRADKSLKIIASVCSAATAYKHPSINTQADLYHLAYKPVSERFQYFLQDETKRVGIKQAGLVVCDHRGKQDDTRLQAHHQMLMHSASQVTSKYDNLVEGLLLQPSNLSFGIQLADMVAGPVWRKFERGDDTWFREIEPSFRRNYKGNIDGYGLVKVPHTGWK